MIFNVSGGGGNPLNFKIVGGTAQPSSPRENTIWVNTEDEITSWIFSVEEHSTPTSGMVWIQVGSDSNVRFNALKKNALCVYPITCNQYINGEWESKSAKIYQDSAWVQIPYNIIAYNEGVENVELTLSSNVTRLTDRLQTSFGGQNEYSSIKTEPIDFYNHKTVQVGITATGSGSFRINFKLSIFDTSGNVVKSATKQATNESSVLSLDVTGLIGEYVVSIMMTSVTAEFGYGSVNKIQVLL